MATSQPGPITTATFDPASCPTLVIHNHYLQAGGEDTSFAANAAALSDLGFPVFTMEFDNNELLGLSAVRQCTKTIWNNQAHQRVFEMCRRHNIKRVHIHNTFPFASPSVYYAADAAGAKVYQWLHNYRLICPAATFMREQSICEKCLGKAIPYPAVIHGCYRDSRPATAAVVAMLAAHRLMGSWRNKVHRYIALTEFGRGKFVEAGFPADKIVVVANHLDPDPGEGAGIGNYGIFVGRLSPEKGVDVLIDLAREPPPGIRLKVLGSGPLERQLADAAASSGFIEMVGQVDGARVLAELKDAQFMAFPSRWYEGLPRTIMEAFAVGTPVIASPVGAMRDLIKDGVNGLHFGLGDAQSLRTAIAKLVNDEDLRARMRRNARKDYLANFTQNTARRRLLEVMSS